jgi:hypothetical protein
MAKRMSRPDCVRKLSGLWSNNYNKEIYLKSVSIQDGAPLRGVKDSSLNFEFPVSVICGANGAGKTTFLSLSLLGFHAKERPLVPLRNIEYFDFNYFFRSAVDDKPDGGVRVNWRYTDGSEDCIEKGEQRWMRYIRNSGEPRRPIRGTEFVGISRMMPAFEKRNYHSYFANKKSFKEREHVANLKQYLSYVMSKVYSAVSELTHANSSGIHSLQSYNNTHTSFNAGAGEECLSYIIGTLLKCPEGSIVAIEEVEIGLHPSTLPKLVDVILEIALLRKLQVIITSHSSEFLRSVPKEGLVLAERFDDCVEFVNQPNVEYAIRRIGGDHRPAASIVCEDAIASKIISAVMPAKLRSVCPVVGFGGKDQLIDKAETVKKYAPTARIIIVWDGEVPERYIQEAKQKGFIGCRLPGKEEPENYLVSKLKTKIGKDFLRDQYELSQGELYSLMQSLDAVTDPHDYKYVLADKLEMKGNEDSVIDAIIKFVVHDFSNDFDELLKEIRVAIN